ncbi:FecR family protein [bacterium A37T11]|nr:FecR family protein [bacterium A37T11]
MYYGESDAQLEPNNGINHLFQQYLNGYCNDAEIAALYLYFNNAGNEEELRELICKALDSSKPHDDTLVKKVDAFTERVGKNLQKAANRKTSIRFLINPWYLVAAAILIVSIVTGLFFYQGQQVNRLPTTVSLNDIAPGSNQAILTLADGTKINLDSSKAGIQIKDGILNYNDGTKIEAPIHQSSFTTYNTLTTPKGGQYHVVLGDGTKIWLNSASKLTYPNQFNGDSRVVYLEGEAYFEIKQDKMKPFRVQSKNQEILVLGTSFNLSAYGDEATIKTTLVQGAIQVTNIDKPTQPGMTTQTLLLSPGEQSLLSGDILQKKKTDVEVVTAWKNGFFQFDGTVPMDAFNQLSRWYDLVLEFKGRVPTVRFYGMISRDKSLNAVLEILKESGLNFKIEKTNNKNKLIVTNE